MKKLKSILCVALLLIVGCFAFVGCGKKDDNPPNNDNPAIEMFDINFYVNENLYYTIETGGNEILQMPSNPQISGYNFEGWYTDVFFNQSFDAESYKDKALKKDLNVYAKLSLIVKEIKIEALTETFKTEYIIGETISLQNSKIKVTSNDNTFYETDVEESMISNFSTAKYGTYKFKITYKDLECEIEYNVKDDPKLFDEFAFGRHQLNGKIYISGYLGNKTKITLPTQILGESIYGVTGFLNNSTIEEVIIPNGIKELSDRTFTNCASLKKVSLPNTLTVIDVNAFANCSSLEEINLPASLLSIGSTAFQNCKKLTKVTFGNSLVSIGMRAFYGCIKLENVVLPNSLKSIGTGCFYDCTSLYSVETSVLNESIFRGCTNLMSITLREGITTIDNYAFYDCPVDTLYIPTTVTQIGKNILSYKSSQYRKIYFLSTKTLPITAETSPFGNSNLLAVTREHISIYCHENLTSQYSNLFPNYSIHGFSNLQVVNGCIIDGTTLIQYIGDVSNVEIPEFVETIGLSAFSNQYIEKIVIPNNVTKIENYAFRNCKYLKEVVLHEELTKIGINILQGCDNIEKLVAPIGSEIGISSQSYYFSSTDVFATPSSLKVLELTKNSTDIQSLQANVEILILPSSFIEINVLAFGEHNIKYILCEDEETAYNLKNSTSKFNDVVFYIMSNNDEEFDFTEKFNYYEFTNDFEHVMYSNNIYAILD